MRRIAGEGLMMHDGCYSLTALLSLRTGKIHTLSGPIPDLRYRHRIPLPPPFELSVLNAFGVLETDYPDSTITFTKLVAKWWRSSPLQVMLAQAISIVLWSVTLCMGRCH